MSKQLPLTMRASLLDRMDALAARLEMDGQYANANIVVGAYIEICGRDPPEWRAAVDREWPKNNREEVFPIT